MFVVRCQHSHGIQHQASASSARFFHDTPSQYHPTYAFDLDILSSETMSMISNAFITGGVYSQQIDQRHVYTQTKKSKTVLQM